MEYEDDEDDGTKIKAPGWKKPPKAKGKSTTRTTALPPVYNRLLSSPNSTNSAQQGNDNNNKSNLQPSSKQIPNSVDGVIYNAQDWVNLCVLLNDLLFDDMEALKLRLLPMIKKQKWADWMPSVAIEKALDCLKTDKGREGLRHFKQTLIQLQANESIRAIEKSSCAALFS